MRFKFSQNDLTLSIHLLYKMKFFRENPMPNPLVILENHQNSAAKEFIINNVSQLKEFGYKKILIEASKEYSADNYKAQLRDCCKEAEINPSLSPLKLHAKPMLEMLETLDKYQILYEFIDPQSEDSNNEMLTRFFQKYKSGGYRSEEELKREVTAEAARQAQIRDKEMSATTMKQAKQFDGGVIFLGGFMHKDLVSSLRKEALDFRFAIFNNSLENREFYQNEVMQAWIELPNDNFRQRFYSARVNYFDLQAKPSFEQIKEVCGLRNEPTVVSYLRLATHQEYSYHMDSDYVVSATTQIAPEKLTQVTDKLKAVFPGLNFFTHPGANTTALTIPGVNLPENHDVLASGFISQGVMKR
jgi:hypothetical protein